MYVVCIIFLLLIEFLNTSTSDGWRSAMCLPLKTIYERMHVVTTSGCKVNVCIMYVALELLSVIGA